MPFSFWGMFRKKPDRHPETMSRKDLIYILPSKLFSKDSIVVQKGFLFLCENEIDSQKVYEIIFRRKKEKKMVSICRTLRDSEARDQFSLLQEPLNIILESLSMKTNRSLVHLMTGIVSVKQNNREWTVAHVAARLCLDRLFALQYPKVCNKLDYQTEHNMYTPVHVAIEQGNINTVRAILDRNPNLELKDVKGNTVLHYAALTRKEMMATLLRYELVKGVLSIRNYKGCTPLHVACYAEKPENLMEMLRLPLPLDLLIIEPPTEAQCSQGKQRKVAEDEKHEIVVVEEDVEGQEEEAEVEEEEVLLSKEMLDEFDLRDMKFGGCPLHWVKSRKVMIECIEMGFPLNTRNINGETATHVMTRRRRLDCLISLLCYGAQTDCRALGGATALHYAVIVCDISIVQSLIIFDADITAVTNTGESVRHLAGKLAANQDNQIILHVAHSMGAPRCDRDMFKCSDGCSSSGTFDGLDQNKQDADLNSDLWYTDLVQELSGLESHEDGARVPREGEKGADDERAQEKSKEGKKDGQQKEKIRGKGANILSLDGGGIRGIVSIQILIELEKRLEKPIASYFEWIIGTSTGSIIAALLCSGYSLSDVRKLYLTMKDKVLAGSKPYSSAHLESLLKHYLGDTVMSDIKDVKLIITGTLADRNPAKLHLFRNYQSAKKLLNQATSLSPSSAKSSSKWHKVPIFNKQKVWEACRASGAAPMYFRAHGPFLDGGLIANNPTLDAIAEFTVYNDVLRKLGRFEDIQELDLILSIGTGRWPPVSRATIDVGRIMSMNPTELYRNFNLAASLLSLLIAQVTNTEGYIVRRAETWCHGLGVPYHRFNPDLTESIALDETNDSEIIRVLWETKLYMKRRESVLDDAVKLLEQNRVATEDQFPLFVETSDD